MSSETQEAEAPKGFKIVEQAIDGGLTVKRTLVPVDTQEEDTPIGSILLNEDETKGMLSRQAKPDIVIKGDKVWLRDSDGTVRGTVNAILKSGKCEVAWDNGTKGRYEPKDLAVVF